MIESITKIGFIRRSPLFQAYRAACLRICYKRGGVLMHPPYPNAIQALINDRNDIVRHATITLAIETIKRENISGSFAELGVWRGETSKIVHTLAPERRYYLFDTFTGFPPTDGKRDDNRFTDTSVELVKRNIGDTQNLVFRAGFFPETAKGLESEKFAFVLLDADRFDPTLAGLEFFYPRLMPGAYLFLHDYTDPEAEYGVSRASRLFMKDKPEKIIELADSHGSAVFRKL